MTASVIELEKNLSEVRSFTITEKVPNVLTLIVNRFFNMKAVLATFNLEKALVGAFSVIVKLQTS